MTHLEAVYFAVEAAKQSPCRSKRGVVAWDQHGIVSVGFNDQPAPFICDGSEACKKSCGRTGVHAEQLALLAANRSRLEGAEMLHIKVVDGQPVPSGGPSCIQCSKLILATRLKGMWLLHDIRAANDACPLPEWRHYTAAEFHYKSSTASDHLNWNAGKDGPNLAPGQSLSEFCDEYQKHA